MANELLQRNVDGDGKYGRDTTIILVSPVEDVSELDNSKQCRFAFSLRLGLLDVSIKSKAKTSPGTRRNYSTTLYSPHPPTLMH